MSLGLVTFGLGAPFSAALMERFGVRRVMLVALVVIAAGASATTLMHAPWQLDLLWGVAVGSATGAVSVPLAATVATRWFDKRRGLRHRPADREQRQRPAPVPPLARLARVGVRLAGRLARGLGRRHRRRLPGGRAARASPSAVGRAAPLRPARTSRRRRARSARSGRRSTGCSSGCAPANFWLPSGSFFICGLSTNGLIGTHLIAGWIFASHQLGAAFAAWGAGAVRSWLGSYEIAFFAAGAACPVAAAAEAAVVAY